MKWTFLVMAACLSFSVDAFATGDLYSALQSEFYKSGTPEMSSVKEGWYTGRCVTKRDSNNEKSGVIVFMVSRDRNDNVGLKQIIPASSLMSDVSYFDEIDSEEYAIYSRELYEQFNPVAQVADNALKSLLHYSILVGTMYTRQSGSEFLVAFSKKGA